MAYGKKSRPEEKAANEEKIRNLIRKGLDNKQIGARLGLSESHICRVRKAQAQGGPDEKG